MSTNRQPHKQRSIEKIRNAKVLERLIKHFNGELELSATQVNVGLSLIKKLIPDLKQTEHTGTIEHKNVKEMTLEELYAIAATGSTGNNKKKAGRGKPAKLH